MKPVAEMSAEELAAHVCQTLSDAEIKVTLTGGACVSIWSEGRYVSSDLDFIEEGPVPRRRLRDVLRTIGFREKNRYFIHTDTEFFIEFPTGPLMVGDERVTTVAERKSVSGLLRLLSPTDCVKDRLAAFYHWKDEQSLEQALMVARSQQIILDEVQRWSTAEGMGEQFEAFKNRI